MDNINFKAIYGVFNINMDAIEVIDVTELVLQKFQIGSKIHIPAKQNFNEVFSDPQFGKVKFLQLDYNGRKYNIIEDNYDADIEINLNEKSKKIKIVYYVYVNRNSNWRGIISGQLLQLKSYGILDEADLHVHITDTKDDTLPVIELIKALVVDAIITTSKENNFEFPAIKLVYDLAHQNPDSYLIYFHSKGMSYNVHSRKTEEITLLKLTFENWRKKLQIFNDKRINKIGLMPAIGDNSDSEKQGTRGGWIWFNFWYARASYIINCDEPFITEDRYYFEHWLGLQNGTLIITDDCFNLHKVRKQSYFTPSQASLELENLTKKNIL
ncbi:hypothetical protein J7E50_17210 [Pedobacter sp. ISL-68]|uniref:hypothetical protein n=1 Tax=unclassified Pedobacter TaxID=2628915 RepID=UPI001BEADF55|nr:MULTISPECIES: hypothetical protein [unclassified Pedobacter]MBT2559664.1 hypothetical protein [Pedobacter sp. ISL-64]MBT2591969.1 hypothetical protein [Pedobacter sp. ISL-68]